MNTPKLPPLPTFGEWQKIIYPNEPGTQISSLERFVQAYALAAIEAQGVPDGWQLVPKEPTKAMVKAAADAWLDCGSRMVLNKALAAVRAEIASAPPAPQAEDDSAASVNDTNAALASRYFELLKVVEQYEKSGVTCQTFRHFISEPCAECNSPGICGKQASVLQQELLASAQVVSMNDMQGVIDWLPHQGRPIKVGDYLYTHPAQQPKPQKLPVPPPMAEMLDVVYAEGWNACCDAYFGGIPAPEPVVVTIERDVPQPLTTEQKWEMWTDATIEQPSARGCYFRGVEDAEAKHGIKG